MAEVKLENQLAELLRESTRRGRKRSGGMWLCPFRWEMRRPDVESRIVIMAMITAAIH